MSQNFKTILGTDKINNSRAVINNNFETLKSSFEGDVAPTEPVKGQQAFINGIPKWFDGADWRVMDDFHTHSDLATKTELSNGLSGKSDLTHTHTDLATNTALASGLSLKSDSTHNHNELYATIAEVDTKASTEDLNSGLAEKVSHTELNDRIESLSLGEASTHDILPVENGGTGAGTMEEARTNLGLGSVAIYNVGDQPGCVPVLDSEGFIPVSNTLGWSSETMTRSYYATSNGSWTVPANVYFVKATICGGGGGASGNFAGGSGGIAYTEFYCSPGDTVSWTLGGGGNGVGSSNNSLGGTGGTSTFYLANGETMLGTGGKGGHTTELVSGEGKYSYSYWKGNAGSSGSAGGNWGSHLGFLPKIYQVSSSGGSNSGNGQSGKVRIVW